MAKNTTRGGRGKFTRTIDTAERDADAARLRARGHTYEQIAEQLGFQDRSNARRAVERALKDTLEEPAAELRALELERLDQMWRAALEVLEREHVHVSGGSIVRVRVLEDGKPVILDHNPAGEPVYLERDLLDDGPSLQAIDRMLRVQERRAKLLGLDAPTKVEAAVSQVEPEDIELVRRIRERKAALAAEDTKRHGQSV